MKIVWAFDEPRYLPMCIVSMRSAARMMPGVELVQVSPAGVPRCPAADTLLEAEVGGCLTRRVWQLRAQVEGDVLSVDCDIVFRGGVRHVFDEEFTLAVPWVNDPSVRATGGVVFQRSARFWAAAAQAPMLDGKEPPVQDVLALLNRLIEAWGGVKWLPHELYERLPMAADDDCAGAAIVHYRGPRKRWMLPDWDGIQFSGEEAAPCA